ncbi:L-fucose dehydrogenase [Acrocarpospora phusangensis]|uniref:L-fucose dehydrogenase n=2 Tax=Acrocarpospora phusangensis TaxID=1070424 RepID=A0A919QEB8_9ACTN|nr:L-fucose dehydrogenase [Acrocarpospora phusangensis]
MLARAEQPVATMLEVFDGDITFVDTSNEYPDSELRIGEALRARGGLPEGFVLATKVDPDPVSGDFSGDRVRASAEESLTRLGLDRLPLLYFHDPERIGFEEGMAPGGAVEALVALREEGVVDHVGVAGGPVGLLRRYVATGAFEAVITHNRYTLVDRSAEPLLAEAAERGIAVVNGAPYGGGMLVKGPDAHPDYGYRPAGEETRNRVRAMRRICEEHGVPLAAAALQFSLREPRIASTIVGITAPGRVAQTLELAGWPIPDEMWDQLEPLAAPREDWLN